MDRMHLKDVEDRESDGHYGRLIRMAREVGSPVPQIWHLFAYKPRLGEALSRFTHEVMRGPSPLSPGLRELIAAYTSRGNQCLF
ncbi:peroxidase [Myxococcus xanthus]|uniref:Peroxidase n=1 Tax=Myxococcus xanthus TaxID=34 RepID=A0AAE6FZU3_MYXXA|nr:peroxidase [Myxococcus xanthus]QVW65024.1 peroxidase [Myxococcus xanthus DZ2]QDE68368.1 peroxidase [Myxococcus xanthus]QDE75645.1 peroxidase [Myxococcus xanthus]QDE82972.1 peroxidase [Myxococcus xanthus]